MLSTIDKYCTRTVWKPGQLVVCLLSVSGIVACQQATSINLLSNGDFDDDIDSWEVASNWPVAWSGSEGGGAVRVTAVSNSAATGRRVFSQCVEIAGSQAMQMGARFKKDPTSNQTGGGRMRVSWFDGLACEGDAETDTKWAGPNDDEGWQDLRVDELKAPVDAQSVRVTLINSIDGRGEYIAYWDDIYLRPTADN